MSDGYCRLMKSLDLKPAILAALKNGDRLTDDSELLLEGERFPSSYALALLAQEEYAKAFLLCLVSAGALPWTAQVKHALHDHVCKQLASVILDYLSPDIDEFLRRHELVRLREKDPIFPAHRFTTNRNRMFQSNCRSEPSGGFSFTSCGRLER
jgi:AbiV family abortive infection protein